jgi:hypothetical protein
MKVCCRLLAEKPPVADQPVGRLLLEEIAEGINVIRRIAGAMDLYDGPQALQFAADLLHLFPYVRSRHRAKRDKDRGTRGLQDFHDLMRLQKRVHGIGNTSGFRTEHRDKGLRQKGKQETNHVASGRSKWMEHIRGLGYARDKIAVGNDYRRFSRVGVREELDRRSIGICSRAQLDGIVGSLDGNAITERNLFEGADVRFRGKRRIILPINRSSAWMPAIFPPPVYRLHRLFN